MNQNMAYLNKEGEIELTREDEKYLREKVNIDVEKLMNWIVWGNTSGFIKNNNFKKNDKN